MNLRTRLLLTFSLLASLALAGTGGAAIVLYKVGIQVGGLPQAQVAHNAGLLLGLLAGVTLLIFVFSSRLLHRELLDRLLEIKAALEAIAGGDCHRRVPVRRLDEIGLLARELNAALDDREEIRGRDQLRLVRFRQFIAALLGEVPEPAVAVGLDGILIASNLAENLTREIETRAEFLRVRGSEALTGAEPNPGRARLVVELAGGHSAAFRPLLSAGRRPVGWLGVVM